jgi:translation initiation factor SUI1
VALPPALTLPPCRAHPADPFAEDTETKKSKGGDSKDYVHIRVQQRNGKKSLTTVQGLPQEFDYKKILKALKKGEPQHGSPPQIMLLMPPPRGA